jgi:hypothetical protein
MGLIALRLQSYIFLASFSIYIINIYFFFSTLLNISKNVTYTLYTPILWALSRLHKLNLNVTYTLYTPILWALSRLHKLNLKCNFCNLKDLLAVKKEKWGFLMWFECIPVCSVYITFICMKKNTFVFTFM